MNENRTEWGESYYCQECGGEVFIKYDKFKPVLRKLPKKKGSVP